jgi:hypothetical protein
MSTYEQHTNQNLNSASKKAGLKSGTTLANPVRMKRRITYKEIVLAFGIVIAAVIIFTLWINNPGEQSSLHPAILPYKSFPIAAKTLIQTTADILF